jgi:hypothetical protein
MEDVKILTLVEVAYQEGIPLLHQVVGNLEVVEEYQAFLAFQEGQTASLFQPYQEGHRRLEFGKRGSHIRGGGTNRWIV